MAGLSTEILVKMGLNATSAVLFTGLVALGLVIIFGMMKVINMAHGEFVMLGSYTAVSVTGWGYSFWWSLLLAPIIVGLVGLLLERLVVRRLFWRTDLSTLLATWGASILLQEGVKLIFGARRQSVSAPLGGSVMVMGAQYPAYLLTAMGICVVTIGAVFYLFFRSPFGISARATIQNGQMASLLGIPTRQLNSVTFTIGAGLTGLSGALLAPLVNISPVMGVDHIAKSFFVAIMGGMGNIIGSLGGAMVVAGVESLATNVVSGTAAQIMVLILVLVLMLTRPDGLFRSE